MLLPCKTLTTHHARLSPLLALLLLLLLLQPSLAQFPSSGTNGSTTVSGAVVNSVTHEPIARALVYTTDQSFATFTNDRGQFELTVPAPQSDAPPPQGPRGISSVNPHFDRIVLQVMRPGYLFNLDGANLAGVLPGQTDVVLSLLPESLLVGKVKFPTAEAGDQVRVQLYRREVRDGFAQWTPQSAAMTRSEGEFRFASLRPGDYRVFTAENMERDPVTNAPSGPVYGFPPRFYAAAKNFGTADTIPLRAGETVTVELVPERQRYFEVRVPVAVPEEGGNGVSVSVFSQGHRGPGFELSYNPERHSIMGSLPNGAYTIEASTDGEGAQYGVSSLVVENAPAVGSTLTLTVVPPIEVNLRADSPPDSQRQPPVFVIPAQQLAYVHLLSAEEFANTRGRASTNGTSSALAGVKPGRYWVEAQAPMGYVASLTSGTSNLFTTPLVVPYGGSVPPIELNVRYDGGEIAAAVEGATTDLVAISGNTRAASLPQSGTYLYCIALGNEGNSPMGARMVFNDQAVWQNLAPGPYLVLAFDSPHDLEYRNPEVVRKLQSQGQVVRVEAGQKAQAKLHVVTAE